MQEWKEQDSDVLENQGRGIFSECSHRAPSTVVIANIHAGRKKSGPLLPLYGFSSRAYMSWGVRVEAAVAERAYFAVVACQNSDPNRYQYVHKRRNTILYPPAFRDAQVEGAA